VNRLREERVFLVLFGLFLSILGILIIAYSYNIVSLLSLEFVILLIIGSSLIGYGFTYGKKDLVSYYAIGAILVILAFSLIFSSYLGPLAGLGVFLIGTGVTSILWPLVVSRKREKGNA